MALSPDANDSHLMQTMRQQHMSDDESTTGLFLSDVGVTATSASSNYEPPAGSLAAPRRVVRAWPVDALVRVPAEEVTLRLHHSRRGQPRLPHRVVVSKAGAQRGRRHAVLDRAHDSAPPALLRARELGAERAVEQDRVAARLSRVHRGADVVEQVGADDAAALPDARQLGRLDLPALLL